VSHAYSLSVIQTRSEVKPIGTQRLSGVDQSVSSCETSLLLLCLYVHSMKSPGFTLFLCLFCSRTRVQITSP
jgi:hypothetical protein